MLHGERKQSLSRQVIIGVCAALSVVFVWSGWIVVSRLGVSNTLTVYDVAGLRFGVGTLAALPFLIRSRCWRGLTPFKILVLTGGAGAPYTLLCYWGFTFAPAAHGGVFVNGCLPLFTAVIAWFWYRQSCRPSQLAGMALILVGVSLVGYEGFVSFESEQVWIGDGLFLCAAITFSIYMVGIKVWRITPGQIIFTVTMVSGVIYVPIWLLMLDSNLGSAPWSEIVLQGGYQGLVASVFGIACMTIAIRNLGANIASAFMPGVPVVSALLAIPLLGEIPGAPAWVGMIIATIGIFLALGIVAPQRPCRASA